MWNRVKLILQHAFQTNEAFDYKNKVKYPKDPYVTEIFVQILEHSVDHNCRNIYIFFFGGGGLLKTTTMFFYVPQFRILCPRLTLSLPCLSPYPSQCPRQNRKTPAESSILKQTSHIQLLLISLLYQTIQKK